MYMGFFWAFDSLMHSLNMSAAFIEEVFSVKPFCSFDCVGFNSWLCLLLRMCSKILSRMGVTEIPR